MAIRDALARLLTPQKTKVWHKLALLAATLVLPVTALNWMLLAAYREQISFASKEVQGEAYLKRVRTLAEHLIEHRGLANVTLLGETSARKELLAKQTEIEDDLKAVAGVDQELGAALVTRREWTEIRNAWPELKRRTLSLTPRQSFEKHAQIIQQVLALFRIVDRSSNLRFDPIPASYYFMDVMTRIPSEADTLGQIRDLAVAAASQKQLGSHERAQLLMLIGQYRPAGQALADSLKDIFSIHSLFEDELKAPLADQQAAADDFLALVDARLLSSATEPISIGMQELADSGGRAVSTTFRLYDGSAPNLKLLLQGRIDVARSRLVFGFLASAVGVLLTVAIGYFVTKVITRQVQSIIDVFAQISVGDYQARAEVVSTDELGSMAASLNTMLDNTLVLIQSQTERNAIQQAIVKLLNEVSGVAEGDLSREAEVTDDVTGAIADAFNYMIYQLRRIISDVQDATLQVGSSAGEIHDTTDRLVKGSQIQAEQLLTTSAAIEEIALSIQQVSENAAESATVAQQALANATRGNQAVQDTIEGMDRIRDQAQETAKRIKRLGESSQEIGQIIQLIDDIADRTSILALNASIQAAAAGDAGRGFAVVAEEVERLAERSTDATKKIATLIKTIQSETNEAVGSMEKSIHEVVEGSKLANQAGEALEEIGSVSSRLAVHIQSISQAAKQQAQGSEAIAKSMTHISDITRESAAGTRQAAESVNLLAALAEALRSSVSTFRLPGRSRQGDPPSSINGHPTGPNGHQPERNGVRSGSGEFRRLPARV